MSLLEEGPSYWASLSLANWLTLGYVLALTVAVVLINWTFSDFVASQPEGRKTVLGKFCH